MASRIYAALAIGYNCRRRYGGCSQLCCISQQREKQKPRCMDL